MPITQESLIISRLDATSLPGSHNLAEWLALVEHLPHGARSPKRPRGCRGLSAEFVRFAAVQQTTIAGSLMASSVLLRLQLSAVLKSYNLIEISESPEKIPNPAVQLRTCKQAVA